MSSIIVAVSEQLNVSQSKDDQDVMDMQQTLPPIHTRTATSPATATSHCVPHDIFTPTKTRGDVYHSASTSTTLRRQLSRSKYL